MCHILDRGAFKNNVITTTLIKFNTEDNGNVVVFLSLCDPSRLLRTPDAGIHDGKEENEEGFFLLPVNSRASLRPLSCAPLDKREGC